MTHRSILRVVSSAVILSGLFGTQAALACKCADVPIGWILPDAALVIRGKVVSIGERTTLPSTVPFEKLSDSERSALASEYFRGNRNVNIRVSEIWKGPGGQSVTVRTGSGGGDCGVPFKEGGEYLVIASGSESESYSTNICLHTGLLKYRKEELRQVKKQLGKARVPTR